MSVSFSVSVSFSKSLRCLTFVLAMGGVSGAAQSACVEVAKLTAFEGLVSIKPRGKVLRVSPGPLPRALCAGDEVHTLDGRARISDGRTTLTLDQQSVAAFPAAGSTAMNQGKALFEVRKRGGAEAVAVKTRLSVIGVKGTRFLVGDDAGGVSVVLDEGVVDVDSTQGPVGLFREKPVPKTPEEEYAEFAKQHHEGVEAEQKAFDEYKKQTMREFVAYVESLTLQAGKELVTSGHIAVERDIRPDNANAIKSLKTWAPRP